MKRVFLYGVFAANLAVTVFFWWQGSGILLYGETAHILIALGRLAGLISMLFILTQLVLVGRIKYVEREYGHDKLNQLHRLLGKSLIFVLIFHPILLTIGYAMTHDVGIVSQFFDFIYNWEGVRNALIGFLLLCFIVSISIAIVRRKLRYETWYFTHLFIYVAIYLFFSHQIKTADVSSGAAFMYWYGINYSVFGLLLTYRFLRPLYLFWKHRFYVAQIEKETPTVHSLYIRGKDMQDYHFEPGQFANLTFIRRGMWYTHPFSFSKAPDGQSLRFSIKSSGDFTSMIPSIGVGTKVVIDGPLGVFVERKSLRTKFLFIAGGIGITPIRAMVEALKKQKADLVLLYGNRTDQDIPFEKELQALGIKHTHVLSQGTRTGYERGFIDGEKIKRLVPDFMEREVYLCGPPVMMKSVMKELETCGVAKDAIHFEIFAL